MSTVALANEQMSIEEACSLAGMPYVDAGRKLYCPFGDFHADGGMAPAFRIYPHTNSAYCFACAEAYRPVGLLAKARDISIDEAALLALETVGYVPEDVDDKIEALLAAEEPEVSTEALAQALDTYCGRICPDWEDRQVEDGPATRFAQCVGVLDSVRSPADAARWLAATKQLMRRVLTPDTPEEGDGLAPRDDPA